MNNLKTRIKDFILKQKFQAAGLDQGVHILTFHGLIEQRNHPRLQRNFHTIAEFKELLKKLKKSGGLVLTPKEFEEYVENRQAQKLKKAFLLTFDDGYQNNLTAMAELDALAHKAAYFVSSGAISSLASVWTVNLSLLILMGSSEKVTYLDKEYFLSSEANRNQAFNEIRNSLKGFGGKFREELYSNIVAQYAAGELEELMVKHPYFKMLSAIQIAEAAKSGQCIQSHGVFHELLHQNQTDEVVKQELTNSKQQLEAITGKPVTWFAYPNGDDSQTNVRNILKETGYKMAFSLGQKSFVKTEDAFFIPRFDARQKNIQLLF